MPVKARRHKIRPNRVTPDAVDAYRAGDVLALHRALGLKPWQSSPLNVSEGEVPPWPPGSAGAMAWPLAIELRRELLAAGT